MKIVQINTCNFGSTGNIMINIAKTAESRGHKTWFVYPKFKLNLSKKLDNSIVFGNKLSYWFHTKLSLHTGFNGFGSFFPTLNLLRKIKKINPDIIQLHNLHNNYINLPLLFSFIKKSHIPVIWTLHDCWAFTGQCAYFDMINCQKWKTGCHDCEQIHLYPKSYVDRTKFMWKTKKRLFTGIPNLKIVTPSVWLANCVSQSYMSDYSIKTIHNGIDLSCFSPKKCDLRNNYNIPDEKHIILGVAFGWGKRKGLDVFIELSKRLNPDKYQIILVGTDASIDNLLSDRIISIHKTNDQSELASIYSAADVFLNPTREEVLGLVNIEANACGTPVITFNSGGSPECISEKSGVVVNKDDVDTLEKEILHICETIPFSAADCVTQARKFDMNEKFSQYIDLYESLYNEKDLK